MSSRTQAVAHDTHVVDATMFWSPTGGGVRRYLRTKHAWLARQPGWSHTIAVPTAGGSTEVAEEGVVRLPALPIPGSGGYRLPLRRSAIADLLVGLAPDLIEAGDPFTIAWAAVDAARRRQVPAIAYCHSNMEMMARLFAGRRFAGAAGRAARAYARRVYSRFDRVLAPSESMRSHLVDWGVEHTACQPLGVDCAAFHPARASPAWRRRMGFGEHSRVLVYAGRFAPEKHLDVLAAAVAALGDPYVLLAIGAGPTPPRGARVHVLPFVAGIDELATAFASADAFVHAGDQETFGLSVLEAMACATPVVARSAEGLAELVDDTVGFGVDSGRAEAYAAAIAALFAADLGPRKRAARARAEAHDWERVLPMLLGQYRGLLRGTGAPDSRRDGQPAAAVRLP
ncbi:MAG TPA: glycosyltransferase [Caldimonas sp.]